MGTTLQDYDPLMPLKLSTTLWPLFFNPSRPLFFAILRPLTQNSIDIHEGVKPIEQRNSTSFVRSNPATTKPRKRHQVCGPL